MNTVLHKAGTRGAADHGWLQARHSFSFASYHDRERVHFGALRVWNDDIVAGGQGFGTHPHDNMEIVTVPLQGALAHKDSTGNSEVIHQGEVQIMSAGSGLTHSEFNASQTDPVNLFQIWVFPDKKNITPRYEQKMFEQADRQNKWQLLVSPDKKDEGTLWINQEAWFSRADLTEGQSLDYIFKGYDHGAYLMIIEGEAEVAGRLLGRRDAIGIADTQSFTIQARKNTQIMLTEVPLTFEM